MNARRSPIMHARSVSYCILSHAAGRERLLVCVCVMVVALNFDQTPHTRSLLSHPSIHPIHPHPREMHARIKRCSHVRRACAETRPHVPNKERVIHDFHSIGGDHRWGGRPVRRRIQFNNDGRLARLTTSISIYIFKYAHMQLQQHINVAMFK